MNYKIITNSADLIHFCNLARKKKLVALDTEFVRTRTFYPQVGLIQLYDGEHLSLIDPIVLDDMTAFRELLEDTSVLKILHACSEDIEVFKHTFQSLPTPMIDTQVMGAFLGNGLSAGFASLVKQCLDIDVDKSESLTDWVARPLSTKQLEYAAADVFHLLPLYQNLHSQILDKGWDEACQQESDLIKARRTKVIKPEEAYLNIKQAWQLSAKQLSILKPLAEWRYTQAVKRDISLNFIFKEQDLFSFVSHNIQDLTSMKKISIDHRGMQRHGDTVLSIIQEAQNIPAEEYPLVISNIVNSPNYKTVFADIKKQIKETAEKVDLAPELLASKKQIHQYLIWIWESNRNYEQLPDIMQSWRYDIIGKNLNSTI